MINHSSSRELWSWEVERDNLTDSMFATVYCDTQKGGCGYREKAIFRGVSAKCTSCGRATLGVSEFNQRNAIVADLAERFVLSLFQRVLDASKELKGRYFVKRNVVCNQLELKERTAADLAILNQDIDGPVLASQISCLFEVKMGIIWNWAESDRRHPIADYDRHSGRPSLYRTDSILKAVGKAAIIRSCPGSGSIPFMVVGNTPPPLNYRDKVDGTVRAGLIQQWISLTPSPLVVDPSTSPKTRNPKSTAGFRRIDHESELASLLETAVSADWHYVGAMVEPARVGEIIRQLDLSRTDEEIGLELLKRLPTANRF